MKKYILLLIIPFLSFGQFAIEKPNGWVSPDIDREENLQKYTLSEQETQKILQSNNGELVIAFSKYDPAKYAGIIPTIQVTLLPNIYNNFTEFKNGITASINIFDEAFQNFKIIKPLENINLDGESGFFFQCQFDLPVEDQLITIRSWTYSVLVENKIFQINFSDVEGDDCSDIYKKIIKTIEF